MYIKSVGVKLTIAVVGALLVTESIFLSIYIKAYEDRLIESISLDAIHLGDTVRRSLHFNMLNASTEDIRKIADKIGEQKRIERVSIINARGTIVVSLNKDDLYKQISKSSNLCSGCHAHAQPLEVLHQTRSTRISTKEDDSRILDVVTPIYNEPACYRSPCHYHKKSQKVLGILDIGMSLKDVDTKLAETRSNMIMFSLVSLIIVSGVCILVIRILVVSPVKKLVDGTKRIGTGQLSYEIPVASNDELGILAASFNRMTKDLKETNRQLIQSEKLASLGKLAAGVAHEMNNPLQGILTFAEELELDMSGDDPGLENVKFIISETMRCRQIVRNLLDFAQVERPTQELVSLNEIVEKAVYIVSKLPSYQNIDIQVQLAPGLSEVEIAPNQIQQVILNLVDNARDAMQDKGRITIETGIVETEDGVFVSVGDEGCGISEENAKHIFEPFYSTKGKEGVGLGLSIVWKIVEQHHGKLTFHSTISKGATFKVVLPLDHGSARL